MIIYRFFLSIYCWIAISVLTIIFGVFAVISSFFAPDISHRTARLWGWFILGLCGIKVKIFGAENIRPDGAERSYIITSNHQSYFDIFVLLSNLGVNFRFIAKESLFSIPFLGSAMKRLGYIPIDRKNMRKALKSLKKSTSLLKNKSSILIFPEGQRSCDGKLLGFKKGGLGMLLKEENTLVLPVAIKGTIDILRKSSFSIHPGKTVELHILKPISVGVAGGEGVTAIRKADDIVGEIESEINKILV